MLIAVAEEQKLDVKSMINAKYSADDNLRKPCAHIAIGARESAQHDRVALLDFLLDKGLVGVNARDSKGNTLLHTVCVHQGDQCARRLLAKNETKVNAPNHVRQSPLSLATNNAHYKAIKALLAHPKVKPNWQDRFGSTPLHGAARHADADIVKVLVFQYTSCIFFFFSWPRQSHIQSHIRPLNRIEHKVAMPCGFDERN